MANILFPAPDPQSDPPAKPYEIKLPDGHLTWSIAWEPGTTILWVLEKGIVRSYDFANPAQVKETTLKEFVKAIEVPKPVLDALRTAFDAPAVPSPAPAAANRLTQRQSPLANSVSRTSQGNRMRRQYRWSVRTPFGVLVEWPVSENDRGDGI